MTVDSPDDLYGTGRPQIGRGGHLRNAKGQALVIPADGGRKRIAIGASDLDAFEPPYDGPPIYGDQGSTVHAVTEYADAGKPIDADLIALGAACDLTQDDLRECYDKYLEFVAAIGWTTELTECIVVNDEHSVPIASNIDKVGLFSDGPRVVVDVKSGNEYAKRATMLQLAAYVESVGYDPETGGRTPFDDLNSSVAYLFWYPIRGDRVWRLIAVDVGNVGLPLLRDFFALRDDDRHASAFTIATPAISQAVESPGGGDDERTAADSSPPPTLDELRATVADWPENDRLSLRDQMIADGTDRTDPVAVAAAIDRFRFHDVATEPAPARQVGQPAPTATLPTDIDEGAAADESAIKVLEAAYLALDAAGTSFIKAIAADAQRAGAGIGMKVDVGGKRTVRRFEAMRALVTLCDGFDNDDAVRACAAFALGEELAHSMALKPGALVAAMGVAEAAKFAEAADALVHHGAGMAYRPSGGPIVDLGEAA